MSGDGLLWGLLVLAGVASPYLLLAWECVTSELDEDAR